MPGCFRGGVKGGLSGLWVVGVWAELNFHMKNSEITTTTTEAGEQSQIVENWKDEVAWDSRTKGAVGGGLWGGLLTKKAIFNFSTQKCQTCRGWENQRRRPRGVWRERACAKNFDDSQALGEKGGRCGGGGGAALAFAPCSRWQVINHFNCHFRNTILSKHRQRLAHRRKATDKCTENKFLNYFLLKLVEI